MTALAGQMALRHMPEIIQAMQEHQNQHTPQDATFFFTETAKEVILWCKNCNLGLLTLQIDEPITRQALLSAGWNPMRALDEEQPYAYWMSLSDGSLKFKEEKDWFIEVWFDNNPRYGAGREFMVFIKTQTTAVAAREALLMGDLDHLRRMFAVTRRNTSEE